MQVVLVFGNQLLQRCLCLFSKATGERWQRLPLASDLLLGRKRCEHAVFSVISLQLRISWGTLVFGLVEPIFLQETSVSETSFVPNWQKQKKANICTWFIEVKWYHTPRGTKMRIVALIQWSCNNKLTLRVTSEYVGMNWNIFLKLCMLDFLTQ